MITSPNIGESPAIEPAAPAIGSTPAPKDGAAVAAPPTAGVMENIYVGNLAAGSDDATVRALFATHGAVSGYQRASDPVSKTPAAFAYVEMMPADAHRAIAALNGHELDGHALRVSEARKPRP
jgi:RNA recognition motif